ncbi:MAG: hypothetical protein NUW37_09260 [Planctomycetes bacterium]|nr:hypothetical protein [Planctomycetota bacterium]
MRTKANAVPPPAPAPRPTTRTLSKLRRLTRNEFDVIEKIVDTYLPENVAAGYPSGKEAGVVEFFQTFLTGIGRGQAIGLRALIFVFDLLPLLLMRSLRRFSKMGAKDRRKFIRKLESSSNYYFRQMFIMFKTIVGMGYFRSAEVRGKVGFWA